METTVRKALSLLEVLIESGQPRKMSELARQLSLTRPNVHRLLGTLTELGFVKRDIDTGLYSPTLKTWELGSLLDRDTELVPAASPFLRELQAGTQANVQLAVLDQDYSVCVNKCDSPGPLSGTAPIGSRRHALATASGKALLAWAGPAAVELALRSVVAFTPQTLTKRADVERDLALARERGYTVNTGECRLGIAGIAAPVRNREGVVIASLAIWGPDNSIMGARQTALAAQVVAAAHELSCHMGYTM
jgi:IclR family KDG regulon transcriptional repressor